LKDGRLYRFGDYVLDAERMVLRGENGVIALPPKALLTLLALVEEHGEVVSKQQLMERVWGDTFVEEGNLSQNIFLLRRELRKSAEGLDYIQTLSKRGYRLNVPVERVAKPAPAAIAPANPDPAEPTDAPPVQPASVQASKWRGRPAMAMLPVLILGLGIAFLWRFETAVPRVSDFTQLTHDGAVKRGHLQTSAGPDAALFTDGARIYFTEGTSDSLSIAQVSVSGGETAQIPTSIAGPQLLDVSRTQSELLLSGRSDSDSAGMLWAIPTPAGSPREIRGVNASDASWSPDGKRIAFTFGRELSVANADGSNPKKIAALPGSAWMPRWSPDGQRIRLTVYDTQASGDSLWEVGSEGSGLHLLLKDFVARGEPAGVCCGSWTPDGRNFVFTGLRAGKSEIWSVPDRPKWLKWVSSPKPTQLTGGQLNSLAPLLSPDGQKLFVIGQQLRGELQRFDPATRQFVSYLGGKSMDFLSFSRDGKWITWVEYPERTLWRSRADGSEKLQLTFVPLHAMMPRWSPDASSIVFYAGGGGGGQRAYIISANGGQLVPLGWAKEMLPNWSPDGQSILHSEFPFFAADPRRITLHVVHLKTHQTETIPGSEGLFAAQWSPDGRYIAALTLQGSAIKIFDLETRTWTELGKGSGFLVWSHDSKYLFCLRDGTDPAVVKLRLRDRQVEEVASLSGIRESGQLAGLEFGLSPEEQPYILRDIGTQEIYSLVWHDR
jgi:DNA-binding winged helix-turn-helix (wHTH) protein/Tol biopolymer transport system component